DVSGASAGSVRCFGDLGGSSKQISFSATFRILKEGTHQLSGSVNGYTYDTLEPIDATGGGSITGKAVTSNNNPGGTAGTTNPGNPGTAQDNKD
uniref:hypothetical protein n=1 Tax=Klebsiella pneumoniae TaxID=573 RepID=UPI001C8F9D45